MRQISRLGLLVAIAALSVSALPGTAAAAVPAAAPVTAETSAPQAAATPAAAPTSAPTGLSPSAGDVEDANPVLIWNSVSGATKYRVQVSTAPDFSSITYSTDTQELRVTPYNDLPLGLIYWRVAGMDAYSALGPWADTEFTKTWGQAPAPEYPADMAVLSFPTDALRFTWSALAGAQYYELQVDDASDFVGATAYTQIKNTSYVITEPKTSGQTFYWRVRGTSATSGVVSDWSAARQASVVWPGQPALVYPADNATVAVEDGDLYFDWAAVPGAKTYQLQVSSNSDFSNNVKIDVVVKGTRYAPPVTLNNASYYWRVRALDAALPQNYGPWSSVNLFVRSWGTRPTLLSPANGALSVIVPTFTWTPVDHASWYELDISTDSSFGAYMYCYTNRTSYTPYSNYTGSGVVTPGSCNVFPLPGVNYYWRVRGIDAPQPLNYGSEYVLGVLGLWSNSSLSDLFSFVYQPVIPSDVSPADGATVQVPTVKWADTAGATGYHVTIKSGGTTYTGDTSSTSWTSASAIPLGAYTWYVQAIDQNSKLSAIPAPSNQHSFTLEAITPASATPDPVAPANGASSVDMPSLSWAATTGAAKYQVWYSSHGTGTWFKLGPTTVYPAYTYNSDVFSAGTYDWYVEALDSGGGSVSDSYASARSFVIAQLDMLAPTDYLAPAKCATPSSCTAEADTATLSWQAVPGAFLYTVIVALDPNFTNTYRTYTTTFTTLSPRDSWLDNQANQAYYWFVRPARDGSSGRFDSEAQQNASAYQKRSEGIHLLAPAGSASVADEITFSWEDFLVSNQALAAPADQEMKQYRIQVSTVADFATILDDKIVDGTTFTEFDKTYPEGPLYWRVQAIDGSGNALTWSAIRTLTKASPAISLTSPADGATVTGVPSLQWTPQAFAATYDVDIAKNGDTNFSGTNLVTPSPSNTKMSSFVYTSALASGDYAWRVRRRDADNLTGPWSTPRVFHLVPGAPALIAPADGALVTATSLPTFMFQFSSTQAYPKYVVESSTTSGFTSLKESRTTVMTAWAPTSYYGDGIYYWRVKALNSAGVTVATSAAWSFTVQTTYITLTGMPSPIWAGYAGSVVATVRGPDGNVATGYRGSVHFTSSDPLAILPADYTFTATDAGVHTFSVSLATIGTQSITVTDKTTATITGSQTGIVVVAAVGNTYFAIAPARVLDTRPTAGNIGLSGAFVAGTVRTFGVAAVHYLGGGSAIAVPANATAVTGNLTIVGETASGVVALGPTMTPTGSVTTINFLKGDIRANNVTVGLGSLGTLQAVYRATSGASVHLIFDVTGYFLPDDTGATYRTVVPGRVLDSRPTTSSHKNIGLSGKFANTKVRTFQVTGVTALGWTSALVPAGATAVTGNLTVTAATTDGYVALGPTMTSTPKTSTLNTMAGQNRANGVTVALSGGKLSAVWMGKAGSTADVIFDVTGYFVSGAGGLKYYPITPVRDLDSSIGTGLAGTFATGTARPLTVAGLGGVPADATGISGNLTVLSPSSAGYGFIAPTIVGSPTSSTLNSTTGLAVANGFDVAMSAGKVSIIWMGTVGSHANFSLDVTGYWK
jgi:hypothetical protein